MSISGHPRPPVFPKAGSPKHHYRLLKRLLGHRIFTHEKDHVFTQWYSVLFLPEAICDYFEVTRLEDCFAERRLDFYFDERKVIPSGYELASLISHGFTDYSVLQDFLVEGKVVYLYLRRYKWLNKSSGEIIIRNRDFAFS